MKYALHIALVILACVAGACSSVPTAPPSAPASACAKDEASYDCQVERYRNVNAD